jgi:hypothetical protein
VDSTIAHVKETGLESVDWILLDQNKKEKWTLVLQIKIRRVSIKRKTFIDNVRPNPLFQSGLCSTELV